MNIYLQGNIFLSDIPITASAEHEEELMKSDFVKLSWSDAEKRIIPVDSYIIPFDDGIRYSLLEPYEPEQKSDVEYFYEPQFNHPKMRLSKITFKRPSKDSAANDITLLDWSYVGDLRTLLSYFCEQINTELGLTGRDVFAYVLVGEINDNMAKVSFSTQDILSALTTVANTLDCEWHLDWTQKTLYFGRVMYLRSSSEPQLVVSENIGVPSIRNSKEGYWNAFEPQGSTRNITRKAASGEYVQAGVRLSLRGYDNNKYPDGIVYTDGEGNIITKSQFISLGQTPFVKSLIFEEVYPKLDLYVYNVRYRERYLLEDVDNPDSKVIDHYNGNTPVYKKYAVWYMRLAYPYPSKDNIQEWRDFDISEIRDLDVEISAISSNDLTYHFVNMELGLTPNANYFTKESSRYTNTYIVEVSCDDITVTGMIDGTYFSQGKCVFYTEHGDGTDERDETDLDKLTAFQNAISEGGTVTFVSGVNKKVFPKKYSQIIDGKQLYGQFKVNTSENAESTPLAGRGTGDNGNYGFGLVYLGLEDKTYIDKANEEPTADGDTGIVDMNYNRDVVTAEDYEIVMQQSDDYILPTVLSQLVIPKGSKSGGAYVKDISSLTDKTIGLRGNIVNLYNIVMDDSYTESAQGELVDETKKYVKLSVEDNNSYTFKSDPLVFAERTHSPLYIGEKVHYVDGKNYTSENPLKTRVMKLVTKLDFAFEQEITIGNEVIKGNQQTLKEQVQAYVSVGAANGGSGGGGGGASADEIRQTMKTEGSELFLSKIYDDEAKGLIGFLRGAWFGAKEWIIDNLGNANLNNVTVNGVLRALRAYINNVQSTNYSGDGMLDTGWSIINDYEGTSSKAVFDYLYVRKKAIFEELEIRKMSYIGGNFVFSPSSGRIWRVEAYKNYTIGYDSHGEQVINVDKDDLLGYSEVTVPYTLGGRLLALFSHSFANRFLSRKKLIARKFTPEELAQMKMVRCFLFSDDGSTQTMNWWKVGAQARCQTFNIESQVKWDGERYTGENVANTYWWRLVSGTGRGLCDDGKEHEYLDFLIRTGSAEGDRSVADADSDVPMVGDSMVQMGHRTEPRYSNVIMLETVSEDAPAFKEYRGIMGWDLTGKQKTKISPTTGTVMYSTAFHIETEYGDVLVPKDRGSWEQGMTCYYYDRVEHNGSLWLCITPDGTSTTIEPGDSTAAQLAVWQKQVSKGDKGEVSFKSNVFKRSATKPNKPAASEGSYSNPVPSGWSDGLPSGTDTIWMTTRIFSSDGKEPQQAAWTDVQLMSDTESFDVEFAKMQTNDATPAAPNGHNQHGGDQTQIWFDPSLDTSTDFTQMYWMAERTKNAGVWSTWKITRIKGEKGDNATTTALKYTGPLSATATAPTVATYKNFTWSDAIPTQTEALPNVYVGLWQFTAGTILDINVTPPTQVTLFAHYGKTGQTGTDGKNGTSIIAAPNSFVINQQRTSTGAEPLSNINYPTTIVARDSGTIVAATVSNLTTVHCTAQIVSNGTTTAQVKITAISTYTEGDKTKYYTSGSVSFHVTAQTLAGQTFQADISVPFGCNLLGQYTLDIEEDVKTEVSSKVTSEIDSRNLVNVTTLNTTVQQSASGLSTQITAVNNRLNSGGDVYQSIENRYTKTETATLVNQSISTATEGMVTQSNFEQTASSFSLCTESYADNAADDAEAAAKRHTNSKDSTLRSDIQKTGVIIDGDNSKIKLIGGKVEFYKKDGTTPANISFDTQNDYFYIGGFEIGNIFLGMPRPYLDVMNKTSLYSNGGIFSSSSSTDALKTIGDITMSYQDSNNNVYPVFKQVDGNITLGYSSLGTVKADAPFIPVYGIQNKASNPESKITLGTSGIDAYGKTVFHNNVAFSGSLVLGGTFTLPTSPEDGQMYFCKGLSSDLIIKTTSHPIIWADSRNNQTGTNSSVNLGDDSVILVFSSTYGKWIRFDCW